MRKTFDGTELCASEEIMPLLRLRPMKEESTEEEVSSTTKEEFD